MAYDICSQPWKPVEKFRDKWKMEEAKSAAASGLRTRRIRAENSASFLPFFLSPDECQAKPDRLFLLQNIFFTPLTREQNNNKKKNL
jgi:hypothetical protein